MILVRKGTVDLSIYSHDIQAILAEEEVKLEYSREGEKILQTLIVKKGNNMYRFSAKKATLIVEINKKLVEEIKKFGLVWLQCGEMNVCFKYSDRE